jgi:hypothetical protein
LDGAKIVQQIGVRTNKMIVEMWQSSSAPLTKDPELDECYEDHVTHWTQLVLPLRRAFVTINSVSSIG